MRRGGSSRSSGIARLIDHRHTGSGTFADSVLLQQRDDGVEERTTMRKNTNRRTESASKSLAMYRHASSIHSQPIYH